MGYVWIVRYVDNNIEHVVVVGTRQKMHEYIVKLAKNGEIWDLSVETVPMTDEDGMALHEALEQWAPHIARAKK